MAGTSSATGRKRKWPEPVPQLAGNEAGRKQGLEYLEPIALSPFLEVVLKLLLDGRLVLGRLRARTKHGKKAEKIVKSATK